MARGLCCKMSFMQRKPYLARFMWTSKSDVYREYCANKESGSLRPWFNEKSRGFCPTHTELYTLSIGIQVIIPSLARELSLIRVTIKRGQMFPAILPYARIWPRYELKCTFRKRNNLFPDSQCFTYESSQASDSIIEQMTGCITRHLYIWLFNRI